MGIIGKLKELIFGTSAKSPTGRKTVGELQNQPLSAWGSDDIIAGLQFSATLQLRTPLRVLLRHGETHVDKRTPPPKITKEAWEGIWITKTKTYRSLGVDIDELPEGACASDAGAVRPSAYLPFLIAVRKIVELDEPVEERIKKLRAMPIHPEWKEFIAHYGPSYRNRNKGMEWVIERFFPQFIYSVPRLTQGEVEALTRLGLDTPNRITAASDETLLGINGIGRAKLQAIRDYCSGISADRDAAKAENVSR
jgi:hypothetical protein